VVNPKCQGQGIGRKLLNFAEEKIRSKKGRMVIIETSSLPKYKPTRDFYLKNGYKLEAEIKDFYKVGDNIQVYIKHLAKFKEG